jgi:hypothetical protein
MATGCFESKREVAWLLAQAQLKRVPLNDWNPKRLIQRRPDAMNVVVIFHRLEKFPDFGALSVR